MRKVRILRIIASVLLAFQLLVYIANLDHEKRPPTDPAERAGYYTGMNLWLTIAAILFLIAASHKRKLKRQQESNMIDSIGE